MGSGADTKEQDDLGTSRLQKHEVWKHSFVDFVVTLSVDVAKLVSKRQEITDKLGYVQLRGGGLPGVFRVAV